MNIKKSKLLVSVAVSALTFSMTACKKDPNSNKNPTRIENEKNKAYREDMFNRISAYPYWKATAITADSPVDIYKKGATTDIFSQRPEHQTDYYISAKKVTETLDYPGVGPRSQNEIETRLHFGPKTIQKLRDEYSRDGYKPAEIDERINRRQESTFSLSKGSNGERQIQWVQPYHYRKYTHDYDRTHDLTLYQITSLQDNELKLFRFDKELNTTIRVTFTGSKTIPQ